MIRAVSFASFAEWLAAREAQAGYGASEVAALILDEHGVGEHPYLTRLQLWLRKTKRIPAAIGSEAMESGRYAEAGWLRWYSDRTNAPLVMPAPGRPMIVQHPREPLAFCSPDAFVASPTLDGHDLVVLGSGDEDRGGSEYIGIAGGVDAKNHGEHLKREAPGVEGYGEDGSDVVPRHIYWQCQWTCSCTGLPWWDVAAVFGGQTLRIFRVRRNDADVARVHEAVSDFHHRFVVPDVMPDESAAALARAEGELRSLYPTASGRVLVADETDLAMAYRLHLAQYVESRAGAAVKAYKAWFIQRLGNAGAIVIGHEHSKDRLVTYYGGELGSPAIDWQGTARALARALAFQMRSQPGVDELVRAHSVVIPAKPTSRTMLPKMGAKPEKAAKILRLAGALGFDVGKITHHLGHATVEPMVRALDPPPLTQQEVPVHGNGTSEDDDEQAGGE